MFKKSIAIALCPFFLLACAAETTGDTEDDILDEEQLAEAEDALCVSAPAVDALPSPSTLTLGAGGEFGASVERTSLDTTYASSGDQKYTTQIGGFPVGGWSGQEGFAFSTDTAGAVQATCANYKVEAQLFCYTGSCWEQCSATVTGNGQWIQTPWYSYCSPGVALPIPAGTTSVRVAAKAYRLQSGYPSTAPMKVTTGARHL